MGRSRATRPTRDQKIRITAAGLDARNWLVIADTAEELRLVHRQTGTSRKLKRTPRRQPQRVQQIKIITTLLYGKDGGKVKMETKFKDLPADAQERIQVRNTVSDLVGQAQIHADKADFLVDLMNQTYMGELPTKENAWAWVYNREKVYALADIARDYSYAASEELKRIQDWVNEQNAADGWGGLRNG